MPKTPPRMKLSREEQAFLRRWIYDEAHFRDGPGPAKRLQLEHRVIPADLAAVIAAGMPGTQDQFVAATAVPAERVDWPWTEDGLAERVAEARAALTAAERTPGRAAP